MSEQKSTPLRLSPVTSDKDIETVVKLADEIWHEHFTPIIGKQQVEYMLARFQSQSAITQQLESGWEYILASAGEKDIGYIGLQADKPNKKLLLSKLYLQSSARGKGFGKLMLQAVEEKCRQQGYEVLWLTVNRFNSETIKFYQHYGFSIFDEVKKDIGNGFFMDDYLMHKTIR